MIMEKLSIKSFALKYSLLLGGFLIGFGLFFDLMNFPPGSPLIAVFYLAVPFFIVLALLAYQKANPRVSFKNGFITGLLTSLGSLAYCLYTYVYSKFIDDSYLQQAIAGYRDKLQQENLTAAELAAQMQKVEAGFTPEIFTLNVIIIFLLVGLVSALIIAGVFHFHSRKKHKTAI